MKFEIYSSINDIDKTSWDQITEPDNPFFDYEFLQSLEDGQCLTKYKGWIPYYLTIYNSQKELIAACPLYLKFHSYGEFIFDFEWARAYKNYGLPYYPKLVSAIPFTPVSGKRILTRNGINLESIEKILTQGLFELQEQTKSSSIHMLYCREYESNFLEKLNFMKRYSYEFHWYNQNYQSFDDFLKALTHKNRTQIKKERKQSLVEGLTLETLTGNEIQLSHIEIAYNFYILHHHSKYGSPTYLTKEFFIQVWKKMPDRILLILVKHNNDYVAGSINFYKGKGIFGRYWGHKEDLKFMHFEACYYRQIEFAIQNKMTIFEAGAQGPHKIKRGLIPYYTFSSHWFANKNFHALIKEYLKLEKQYKDREKDFFDQRSPYK